jgi:hypothetical protein
MHRAVFSGCLERASHRCSNDACGPIRTSRYGAQFILGPQVLEPSLARSAQFNRFSDSASDETRERLRPETFEWLADGVIRRTQPGHTASAPAPEKHAVTAYEKDEIGYRLDQSIGRYGK